MLTETDERLVYRAQHGDKTAFGLLVERYAGLVKRIALRVLQHADVAEDLAQEALLQAFLSLDQLQNPGRFRNWLYGITLNVCRSFLRSTRDNALSLESVIGGLYRDPSLYGPTPEEIVERIELRRLVISAVNKLSDRNRAAVILVYYEAYSLHEAAQLLGISLSAIKGRLHKSRLHLQAQLRSHIDVSPVSEREGHMIPVKIVDVRRNKTLGDSGIPAISMQLVLLDENGHRALVIWVGEAEGWAIANKLLNWEAPRPMTHTFTLRLLQAAGATIDHVEINALKEEVFYATVKVRSGDHVREVDARPSDALGLALYGDIPIYVSAEVMEKAGRALPAEAVPTGKGLADMHTEHEARIRLWQEHRTKQAEGKTEQAKQQELAQATDEILAEAFGTGE